MPTDFVPLLPRKPGAASGSAPAPAFTPMRASAHASSPLAAAPATASSVPGAGSGATAASGAAACAAREPVVTLQKDGDRVTGIRVECGCGQVIELACTY